MSTFYQYSYFENITPNKVLEGIKSGHFRKFWFMGSCKSRILPLWSELELICSVSENNDFKHSETGEKLPRPSFVLSNQHYKMGKATKRHIDEMLSCFYCQGLPIFYRCQNRNRRSTSQISLCILWIHFHSLSSTRSEVKLHIWTDSASVNFHEQRGAWNKRKSSQSCCCWPPLSVKHLKSHFKYFLKSPPSYFRGKFQQLDTKMYI